MVGQLIGDVVQGFLGGAIGALGEGAGRLLSGFRDNIKGKDGEGECEEGCQDGCGGSGSFGASGSGSVSAMRDLGTSINISL